MKKLTLITILVLSIASARSQITQSMQMSEETAPRFSDSQLLETWGYLLAERFNFGHLEINEAEVAAIERGILAYVRDEPPPTVLSQSVGQMQQYFTQREARLRERFVDNNKAKELEFFDSLFGKPNVLSLATGLHFEIIKEGTGPKPKASDEVEVHYRGTFIDGEEFDSSAKNGGPVRFRLDSVIPGWTQGVQQIGEGGKIKLYVPWKLGYGEEGSNGIPPASTLIFDIELVNIVDESEAPSRPEAPRLNVNPTQ